MLYNFIFSIIIILIYYVLFVKQIHHDKSMFEPDPHYVKGPYDVQTIYNEVRIGNSDQVWQIPQLPPKYRWNDTNDKIVEVNDCVGKKDGELIPASSLSIYSHIKTQTPILSRHEGVAPFYEYKTTTLDHYFECRNEKEFRLFFCPAGTYFNGERCVSFNMCKNRTNTYVYTSAIIPKTHYFQCENGEPQIKACPPGQYFNRIKGACEIPQDPCVLLPNDYITAFDRDTYTICENNVSRKRFCNSDEYFHPSKKICVNKVCENVAAGVIPSEKTDRFWKYEYAYTVCENGIPVRRENCASLNRDNLDDYELPQTLVHKNETCEAPQLCVNVFPRFKYVPGNRFRTLLANYKHSAVYDSLYGFECVNGQPQKTIMALGERLSAQDGHVETCKDEKLPILDKAHSYYDCKEKKVESCAKKNEVFDYGSQTCMEIDERFHSFQNIPVFKVKGLNNFDNWFSKRRIRYSSDKQCNANQVFEPKYDVCIDTPCQHFGFLSQLPGKFVYVNNEFICKEENGQIVERKYEKPAGSNLDFWSQKFTYAVPTTHCKRGVTRLQSKDFMLNAILYPTCSADSSREEQFIICPSTSTNKIIGTPSICYPYHVAENIFSQSLYNDNIVHTFFKLDIKHIEILYPNTLVKMYDIDSTGQRVESAKMCSEGEILAPYNINTHTTLFDITVNKQVLLKKNYIATNHPYYFIHYDKKRAYHYIGSDGVKNYNHINLIMEKYAVDKALTDFLA